MRGKQPSLFLVKSSPSSTRKKHALRTGEPITASGIYRVVHREHRLPHEVTLLRGEEFPKCSRCLDAVIFELVRAVTFTEESLEYQPQIRLYELPALDDDHENVA